jgi:tetratricopeptide (TPR) repeat protein
MTLPQPPLSLVFDAEGARATAAFFIPGTDARVWLDEIGRWGVAFNSVRICLVPRSGSDRRPCGALAIVTKGESVVTPSPLVQPYACLVDRLYLPADARLHPPMSDAELADALLYPLQVFHPAIGLVGYRDEDLILATDLLAPPPVVEHDWDRADPGLPPAPPLRVVLPSVTPSVETIAEDFRDDIGSAAGEELPPLPEESTMRGLASKSALGMLAAISWLAGHLPGGGVEPPAKGGSNKGAAPWNSEGGAGGSLKRRLQRWSQSMTESLQQSLARARHKELARLLDLLERNMDEALRYALPLRGMPGRGLARPGARLTARNPEYDPRSIGRARPVDGWDVSSFQEQLAAKYRQAANRELGLGRYRRAAYIFAQLLGDFGAAANALRQGRFYREAATLYRDQLKNTGAAAECLEAGGLLLEAVPLYEELGRHEKVGDLYVLLERPDEAREQYRRAVSDFVGRADLLASAQLLETKLTSPDEALATLESGWPQSHRAGECLRAVFELLGRLGRHEAALARLTRLRPEMRDGELALMLSEVLGRVAARYPNAELRVRAADAARIVVGNRLSADGGCGASELRMLVNVVIRLAPEDRLLARDANRYQSRPPMLPALPSPPPPRPGRKPGTEPTLVRAFHLGAGTQPKTVYPEGDHFYAIAVRGEQLLFIRGRWDGSVRGTERRDPLAINTHYRIQRAGTRSAITYAIPLRRADALPPADGGPDPGYPASYLQQPPDARSGAIYDMSIDEHNVLWSLRESTEATALILYAHDSAGRLLSSRSVECEADPNLFTAPTALVARAGMAYVLYDNAIHCFGGDRQRDINLHQPAADLLVSHPHVRPRLVLTFAEGGVVIFPEDGHAVRFGEGLFDPVACFTRGGTLVVIGRGRGLTFRVEREGLKGVRPFEYGRPEAPAAIVPTAEPDGFAVFLPDGLVRVMRLPPQ